MSSADSADVTAETPRQRKPRPDPEGIVFVEAGWDVPQRYVPDPMIGRLFEGFREGRLLASRVSGTGRVIFPPQSVCEVTYQEADEIVEVGPAGTIRTFTIVHSRFGNAPPPPYVVVFVQLDGASTAAGGYLRGFDIDAGDRMALIGRRVRAIFKDNPEGEWSDFWHELQEE